MEDNFSKLIQAAGREIAFENSAVSPELEHRVMVTVARRAIEASRRRARRGLVASLSGLAMLLAGGIAALVVWFPALTPSLNFTWLEKLRIPAMFQGIASGVETTTSLPFLEQWGGVILVLLLAGGAAGFLWCLNSLSAGERVAERINESR
jgi:hypothetical protein